MLPQWYIDESLGPWSTMVISCVVGFGATFLVFLCGRLLTARAALAEPVQAPPPSASAVLPQEEESWSALPASGSWRAPAVAVFVTDERGIKEPVSALVVDRSLHGVCLELNETAAAPMGATLLIRPAAASASIPWTAVEVAESRRVPHGRELQCRFVRTPVWSVRMLLG